MTNDHYKTSWRPVIAILFAGIAAVTFIALADSWAASPTLRRTEEGGTETRNSDFARIGTGADKKLPEKISFNAHIRPIMSDTCFTCHGPDEDENQSSLRLDSFEAAVDDGGAIEPGDAESSLVYERLVDSDNPMPPSDFRHQLSQYDIALFKKWIEQGANYEPHWSYAPIRRPDVPPVNQANLVVNEIDAFVLSRLELEGLPSAERADKATLLRRLSLDLIGLPPTPAELDTFLADKSSDAYQKQVERLLASPHYGERMASQWLDAVRFTDTVGFHGDQNQRVFAYRDYVIDALNNNKPFDQFTREQLAGDLLENPTDEQRIATALIRLNMMTREGGAQPGEYLAKYTADRVRMLGTAWLGATTGCCECHNHKYDPLTAKDFYSLGAFFDDIRQWGVYTTYGYTPNPDLNGFTNDSPFPPEIRASSKSLKQQIERLESSMASAIANKLASATINDSEVQNWLKDLATFVEQHPDGWAAVEIIDSKTQAEKTSTKLLPDNSVLVSGAPQSNDGVSLTTKLSHPLAVKAFRVEVLPDDVNGGHVGRANEGRFKLSFSASVESPENTQAELKAVRPRFVRIELDKKMHLSLAEVQVFANDDKGQPQNIALNGSASQNSTSHDGDAKLAIDGNTDGNYRVSNSVTHTAGDSAQQWWEVDLGEERELTEIVIWNRTDNNYGPRIKDYRLVLLNGKHQPVVSISPAYPDPSTKYAVPAAGNIESKLDVIPIALTQVDRLNPNGYNSGFESRFLQGEWRSGPAVWQLPVDETSYPHTAVYHLDEVKSVSSTDILKFIIDSPDVGRLRISASPLTRFVAGMPAADERLLAALKRFQASQSLTDTDQAALLSAYYLAYTRAGSLPADLKVYRDEIADCRSGYAMTMVAVQAEPAKMLHSRILPRGNWQDKSGEEVVPATPGFLPQLAEAEKRRLTRLDLANWLTSHDNPLPARHYVNRTWKHFFGAGLSNKLDDLGNQGEWPSHPLLMDWLAAEFMETWDMKHIARLIVSSHTYQQAVTSRTQSIEVDPYNRLLSQQSPRRLEAEAVRDNALAISGLLFADYVGGPSIFPYQPVNYYSNIQFPDRGYDASPVELQYRRGVYVHWQRSFLHPMLLNFDAPARDECVADRTGSNSPQQALTLLNDPQFVEASNAFASQLLAENASPNFNSILDVAFKRALARLPTEIERNGLQDFYQQQKQHYAENKSEIDHLMKENGNFKPAKQLDQVEWAAWSQVCRVILNLHETITRY